MKLTIVVFLFCFLAIEGCYMYRRCPIQACKVEYEHTHGGGNFSPRKIWKTKIHFVGGKLFNKKSNKKKIKEQRRNIERN